MDGDWLKIFSAILMVGMVIFIWPRMKHMVKNSPKGSMEDWKGALIPILLVVGFVILLINLV